MEAQTYTYRHIHTYHELLEHLIVVAAREHELACVQLEQAHPHRPQIHGKGVLEAETDLRGAVVTRHHVRCDHRLMRPVGRTKVADGYRLEIFRDEDVVQFDIAMQHIAFLHVVQPDEHLARVHSDPCEGDADLAPIRLEELAQVHVHGMEHQAQVALVLKVRQQFADVLLAFRIFVA